MRQNLLGINTKILISKSVAHNWIRVVVSNSFSVNQQYDVFLNSKCAVVPEMKEVMVLFHSATAQRTLLRSGGQACDQN